ncbi:MAG: DUF21 domain-containing protein, partial [Caldilineaceae bacterium]|nr:DUF21 domain-containing protein [Caldilineaceae bacterium]
MVFEAVMAALLYVASLLIIAFVASAEVALASTSRTRIRQLLDDTSPTARLVDRLLVEPARFLSTLMLLKSGAYVLTGAVIVRLGTLQDWTTLLLILTIVGGWFLLVTVQIVSRACTLRDPAQVAIHLGTYVTILVTLLTPFSALLRAVGTLARNGNEEA